MKQEQISMRYIIYKNQLRSFMKLYILLSSNNCVCFLCQMITSDTTVESDAKAALLKLKKKEQVDINFFLL